MVGHFTGGILHVIESFRFHVLCFNDTPFCFVVPELVNDSLLAAMATGHHLTLATRNLAGFERCDSDVFSPRNA